MYLSFPACIPLLEDPVREALAMAVMDDDGHGASRILWASEDLAELLPDAFLTPTLMQMAENGSNRLFRAFGEFGFGYDTLLVSPDTGEKVMSLGHWAALTLSPERLKVLMDREGDGFDSHFNVLDRHAIPGSSSGDLFVSSLVRGVCEGKGEVWEFWQGELEATLKGKRETDPESDRFEWDTEVNSVLLRREIPTLLRLMRGLEMMAENGEPVAGADYSRLDHVFAKTLPFLWSPAGEDAGVLAPGEGFAAWQGLLESKKMPMVPFPVMTRIVGWMKNHVGPPAPALLTGVEKMGAVTCVALADNGVLPEDPFHVGLLVEKILATPRERGDLVGAWTRLVDRLGPLHPVLAGLPGFLKAGSLPVTARTLVGMRLSPEQATALTLYRALPVATSPVRTLRL